MKVTVLCEQKKKKERKNKESVHISNQNNIDLFAFLYYCYKGKNICGGIPLMKNMP